MARVSFSHGATPYSTGVPDPADYTLSSTGIDEALIGRGAMKALVRHGERLDPLEKKSLSSRRPAIIAELGRSEGKLSEVAGRHHGPS